MPVRGKVLGLRTLSRFALIGMIGGGTAACSSDASRLGDPFTNPFAALTGEPSATGSLPDGGAEGEMAPAPAIRTPRIQSQALPAPGPALSPRPGAISAAPARTATRVATAEPISGGMASSVSGLNPDSGRAMTPRASAPAPQPKLQFGKPVDKAAEKRAAEAAAAKAAEARRDAEHQAAAAKIAEAKAAEAKAAEKAAHSKKLAEAKAAEAKKVADAAKHPRPGQKGTEKVAKADTKAETKPDPKDAAKAEAARKAEADARQAKADAAKKLAEARAAEAAAKAAAKESKEAAKEAAKAPAKEAAPVKVASADASAPIPAAAPQAPAESFRWPAKGRIINGYGSGGNEGINIAVPEGTPVKAAEDGTVAYAGSDVKGYGKLVLVRHNNGYVSAYAHNGELDVRPGEKVKRGQTIAKSGATGNVTSPQLHFEIRKGATPVDPMPHLGG
ncbi:Peptidase M23 [Methylorubrum populi BJ001]|jgi:murein DD-endopeptidase MepM/ murein hydrolase activator NlpD|uniref:Peptidase M23 n=1 Tax=Methylorubrum populi (strain ATCC BAA-705 / NCIMB 13946 / BJ001) TaxID=441620 RepID=B1ZJ07_METPB|nr:M23 family metallopeptidase [Methylorubrum populi]ACB82846.1 Peptidase M23 [Methylorubrum populi BJ001]OAH26825.1 peptidase M23 [Methylorubrum populi]PZP68931.1 MAG: peptidase M23 [Methylorubrum populi]